jgi:hypothetical protein
MFSTHKRAKEISLSDPLVLEFAVRFALQIGLELSTKNLLAPFEICDCTYGNIAGDVIKSRLLDKVRVVLADEK